MVNRKRNGLIYFSAAVEFEYVIFIHLLYMAGRGVLIAS